MSTAKSPESQGDKPPKKQPVALIAGPTASGKSDLAVRLALAHGNAVVINADSAQVYADLAVLSARPTPQDMGGNYPHAPKIFREDCKIDWAKPVDEVYNHIRGLSPYPAAWTELEGKTLKIYRASKETTPFTQPPGTLETDGRTQLRFAAADGFIYPEELQLEGKKRMNVKDFLNGFHSFENIKIAQ